MPIRKKVLVSGRVQGVFFRDTCRSRAQEEGVTGYVANLPDGRVEAAFEGEPAAVDRLVEWCRRGSEPAVVKNVEVVDEDPQGEATFAVR